MVNANVLILWKYFSIIEAISEDMSLKLKALIFLKITVVFDYWIRGILWKAVFDVCDDKLEFKNQMRKPTFLAAPLLAFIEHFAIKRPLLTIRSFEFHDYLIALELLENFHMILTKKIDFFFKSQNHSIYSATICINSFAVQYPTCSKMATDLLQNFHALMSKVVSISW